MNKMFNVHCPNQMSNSHLQTAIQDYFPNYYDDSIELVMQ